jgi:hypothetical protein
MAAVGISSTSLIVEVDGFLKREDDELSPRKLNQEIV